MDLPKSILKKLSLITAKRPATIIRHLIEYGQITSEEIKNLYGYNHPPRAVRDVRELGIPITTTRMKDSEGRTMAVYKFGDFNKNVNPLSKQRGRTPLSNALKEALLEKYGPRCHIYQEHFDPKLLQVDHRVPYEIGGEAGEDVERYMLLSPSANRAKSWTCEHCANWQDKNPQLCISCFWAHPEKYTHIAGKEERRIVLSFTGNEINDYNRLIEKVGLDKAADFIKGIIQKDLK